MEKEIMLSRGDLKVYCKHTAPDYGNIRLVVQTLSFSDGNVQFL